jgi:uncharacterized membrane protein YoaK (UPF0700 family)
LRPWLAADGVPFGWLVSPDRRSGADLTLATVLTAIAGASNAGGFFAIGQYTSHMSGYLSQLADSLASADLLPVLISILALAGFVFGAAFASMLIIWAGLYAGRHRYAIPVAVQGCFLVCFAGGGLFDSEAGRLFSTWCLCFIMGMQNATTSIFSRGAYRTTHVTGTITDFGAQLGRGIYGLIDRSSGTKIDLARLLRLIQIISAFFVGGVIGAFGYGQFGFLFSLPLAMILLGIALPWLLQPQIRGDKD